MRVNAVRMDGISGTDGLSHAAKPGDERRIIRQNKPAILSSVAVGIGRDIYDREVKTYEKRSIDEAPLHCGESPGSGFAFPRDHVPVGFEPSGQRPEAQRAYDRLNIVLFEEQPLHDLGALIAVCRQKRRTLGEVSEDCV